MKRAFQATVVTHSSDETKSLGARLGRGLKKGDVVLLRAELGAGKTTLAQGLIKSLGVRDTAISPTFVIAQSYQGEIPIHHLDFYRLSTKEILAMGAQDYLTGSGEIPSGLVLIEWPERCKGLWPEERLEVHIRIKPRSENREIKLIGFGKRFNCLVDALNCEQGRF